MQLQGLVNTMLENRNVLKCLLNRANSGSQIIDSETYIILGQEVRTELQVIIEVERATGLEASAEGRNCGSLGELSHALDPTKLTLGILRRHLGCPTGPTVVVI